MQPLDRAKSFREITRLFQDAGRITIAAPYFGHEALKKLRLDKVACDVAIYCDLFSGGCNPLEIDRIRKLPHVTVRTVKNLHAKIYLTNKGVVVGSANPSANGLGFEGNELKGLIEACVLSEDKTIVKAWADFVGGTIKPHGKKIEDKDIAKALTLWEPRRDGRTRGDIAKTETLLTKMRQEPEYFEDRNLWIVTYEDADISEAAGEVFEEEQKSRGLSNLDLYEDWPEARPDLRIIDCTYYKKGVMKMSGTYRILKDDHIRYFGDNSSITLCQKLRHVEGLAFPKAEQTEMAKLIARFRPPSRYKDCEVEAYKFARALHAGKLD